MTHTDIILLAIAYSDSFNHIVGMICAISGAYVIQRIRNASQRS